MKLCTDASERRNVPPEEKQQRHRLNCPPRHGAARMSKGGHGAFFKGFNTLC